MVGTPCLITDTPKDLLLLSLLRPLKFLRRGAVQLFKLHGKIVAVVKATALGYLSNGSGIQLSKHTFRLFQAQKVDILRKIEAGFPLEDPGKMLGADEISARDLTQSDIGGVISLNIFNGILNIMLIVSACGIQLHTPGNQNEKAVHIAAKAFQAVIVGILIFLLDLQKQILDLVAQLPISKMIGLAEQVFYRVGQKPIGAIDQKPCMDRIFIFGIMYHSRGNENNIPRQDLIAFVINKITARALVDIIYFKVMMIVLSVGIIYLPRNRITVEIKLFSRLHIIIHWVCLPLYSFFCDLL
jgi:hypothetical protein